MQQIVTEQAGSVTIIPFRDSVAHVDRADIDASTARYKRLANMRLRTSDTVVISGHGCLLKVRAGALVADYQRKRGPGNDTLLRLNRGVHKVKQLVMLSESGYITFAAIEWAIQQDITVILMSYKGELLQVLTPRQTRNARLCYLQYQASESKLGVEIARELVRMKTEAQIEMIKSNLIAFRFNHSSMYISSIIQLLEDGTAELRDKKMVETIRLHEAILASFYWQLFIGYPIKWDKKTSAIIPPHWFTVTNRIGPLSKGRARHAVNPFHAVLNFAYALLQADVLKAIHAAELEPSVGFLHVSSEDRHSLVFDLMECFRSKVDSLVLSFFRVNKFSKGDFLEELSGEVRMNDELRRYVVSECRVNPIEVDRQVRWLRSYLEENT